MKRTKKNIRKEHMKNVIAAETKKCNDASSQFY